jgi:hypothetical protein
MKDWIESHFGGNYVSMSETMVMTDIALCFEENLSVIGSETHQCLASMLYLTFPEIHWVFLLGHFSSIDTTENFKKENRLRLNAFEKFHTVMWYDEENPGNGLEEIIRTFLHGYTPLFDLSGMRSVIIERTLQAMRNSGEDKQSQRLFFDKREKAAIVVDEEKSYAFLHAYIAYKCYFSTALVLSKDTLDRINSICNNEFQFELAIEDICLSFPDEKISNDLRKRENATENTTEKEYYPFFAKIPKRIFVTIGETEAIRAENRRYRKELKANGRLKFYRMLYKPYAGIFNLSNAARISSYPSNELKHQENKNSSGHAAPGRLGFLADILIQRAERILNQVHCPIDAVHAAVLALQAQEILGGRTATLSVKAISLKHQAEVMAECMFYGVEHNFDVKNRFKEIKKELEIIGNWFNNHNRKLMKYNSQLNIVNDLGRIFNRYSQFDEEQLCLNQVRRLSRKIFQERNKVWGWLVSPIRSYFEYLVGGLHRFLLSIILWPAAFIVLNFFLTPQSHGDFKKSFIHTINSFFALQFTASDLAVVPMMLGTFAILVGFFHLGIFISHLYTIVSRR